MDKYLEFLKELLEEENINQSDVLTSFEAWDSLTILSIIASADEQFNVTINSKEILEANTVGGLIDLINSKM